MGFMEIEARFCNKIACLEGKYAVESLVSGKFDYCRPLLEVQNGKYR